MDIRTFCAALFVAAAFILWPVVGNRSGATGAWFGIIVVSGTLVAFVVISALRGQVSIATLPSFMAIAILFIAGSINGVGVYVYAHKTVSMAQNVAPFLVMVSVLMAVFAPIFDLVLPPRIFPTKDHLIGFVLALPTIYYLSR